MTKEQQTELAGGFIGALLSILGGLPVVYIALLGLQALDLVEGLIVSVRLGRPLLPLALWMEVLGKAQTWVVVMVLWLLRLAAPDQVPPEIALMPSAGVAIAFAVHEAFSILKSAVRGGQWVPEALKKLIESDVYDGPERRGAGERRGEIE